MVNTLKFRFLLLTLLAFGSIIGSAGPVTDTLEAQLTGISDTKKLTLLLKAGKKTLKSSTVQSMGYARRALKLAEATERTTETAEACLLLSDGYLASGKFDSALYISNRAKGIFRSLGQKTNVLRAENQTGLVFLNKGDGREAERILTAAAEESARMMRENPKESGLKDLTSDLFNNLFMTYVKQGNYALAKKRLLEYRKAHPEGNSFAGMIVTGNLATVYMMTEQFDTALLLADTALRIAQYLNEPLNISKCCNDLGNIQYSTGNYVEALKYYAQAISLAEPVGEKQSLSRLYNNVASVYKQIGYNEKATHFFLESARIKQVLGDSAGLAVTYNNIGLVYKEMANFSTARKYLDMAAQLNRLRKNTKSLGTNYNGIGDLFLQTGNADSALFYYRTALELKIKLGHKSGMILSMQGIGNVYSELLHNPDTARAEFRKALGLAIEIGANHEIASLNMSLGELDLKAGNDDAALSLLIQALNYARKENDLDMMHKCSGMLVRISIRKGDRDKALTYQQLFSQSGDSLYNNEKTRLTLEMQVRFETERKEHENQLLFKNNELKTIQIRSLAVIALVLFTLGFFVLVLYRQKSRAYRVIVRKNLELIRVEKSQPHTSLPESAGKPDEVEREMKLIANTSLGLMVKLNHLMETERPFLEPGLTIEDLCRKLNTNRTYLSQMINENYRRNFNSYINDLRIREAKRMLADPSNNHLSIQGIGNIAGFSTKAAFHANFKQIVGVTPSYFRKTAGVENLVPA